MLHDPAAGWTIALEGFSAVRTAEIDLTDDSLAMWAVECGRAIPSGRALGQPDGETEENENK